MFKLVILAQALALALGMQVHAETCGPAIKVEQSLLGIALANLQSFEYIHHAIESVEQRLPSTEFCVSALPLSKNTYQYLEYLIQIEARSAGETKYRFTFLFQDASVQALHNVGKKPWVALGRASVQSFFSHVVEDAALNSVGVQGGELDAIKIAQGTSTYKSMRGQVDASTLMVLNLGVAGDQEVSIVGWLGRSAANLYASVALPKSILVVRRLSTGEVFTGEALWTASDLTKPLHAMLQAEAPTPETDLTTHLLKISSAQSKVGTR